MSVNTENQAAGQGDEFVSKKELAARLSVNLRTIERWQHDGHLPYFKVGSVVIFNWTEVLAHLNAKYRVRSRGEPVEGAEALNAETGISPIITNHTQQPQENQ